MNRPPDAIPAHAQKLRRLEEEVHRQARDAEKRKAAGRVFGLLGADPEANIGVLVRQACDLLAGACSAYRRFGEGGEPVVHWPHRTRPRPQGQGANPPAFPAECGPERWKKGEPLIAGDLFPAGPGEADPDEGPPGIRSAIGFPVVLGGEVVGALCVLDTRCRDFDEADADVMEILAGAVSLEEERSLAYRRIRRSLAESEARCRALLECLPVMVHALDAEGRIVAVSDRWLEALGFGREEVTGRHISGFLSPEPLGGGDGEGPLRRLRRRDGSTLAARVRALGRTGAREAGPEILAYLAEAEGEAQTDAARTKLQNRLRMAQKMEAVATLAGGIAHQFNNNLSVITGHLDLFEFDGAEDPAFHATATQIRGAVRRMTLLTDQLLAYARGGKFGAIVMPAARFAGETLSLLRPSLPEGIRFDALLDPAAASIRLDVTQLQTVLAAVIANAGEAMPGGGAITLSCRNRTVSDADRQPGLRPGAYVELAVTDEGEGMPESVRERIFDPFFSTKLAGRGLGMAAVYGIVKSHDGWIDVASTPGSGTTVSILLPAHAGNDPAPERPSRP
jgi:signal transduction histidine kinase